MIRLKSSRINGTEKQEKNDREAIIERKKEIIMENEVKRRGIHPGWWVIITSFIIMEILHLNDSGSSDDPRVIVYLHGGAYVYQPYYEHIAMVERLAQESDARAIMSSITLFRV